MLGIILTCLLVYICARPSLKWWVQFPVAIIIGVAVSIAVPFATHFLDSESLTARGAAIHAVKHLLLNVGGSVLFLAFLKRHYRKSLKQKDVS